MSSRNFFAIRNPNNKLFLMLIFLVKYYIFSKVRETDKGKNDDDMNKDTHQNQGKDKDRDKGED